MNVKTLKTKVPTRLLAKYPELAAITQALEEYRNGLEITAKCYICQGVLRVEEIDEIGTTWVTCDEGCTSYRENYQKAA